MRSSSFIHVLRLKPHEDLKKSLMHFATQQKLKAGIITTCVGSLEQYHLRFANQKTGSRAVGFFEIVSLTGTISDSSCHLHMSLSDTTGKTIGGHLLDDNLVYTTAEIAITELTELSFERVADPTYGFKELNVEKRKPS